MQLNPYGWTDSAALPAPTTSSSNVWDVLNRGLESYVLIRRAEAEADVQKRIADSAARQAELTASINRDFNAAAQLTPMGAWSGASMLPAAGGVDLSQWLLISAIAAGAWLLLGK